MKAKISLNPAAVVDRAIAIVDAEGLEALTIRKVADAFDVTPMALYWHFANKDALLDAVGDAVVAGLQIPADGLELEDYLREAMTSLVDVMRAHPSLTPLVPRRLLVNEVGRDLTEHVLDKLATAGFSVDRSAAIAHYALMIAMTLVTGEPGAETSVKPDERAEAHTAKLALLQSLPADRYPRLRDAAPAMVECGDAGDYYGAGIGIFVAGVMADARSLTHS